MEIPFCVKIVMAFMAVVALAQFPWLLMGRRLDAKHWIKLGFFSRLAVRTVWLAAGLFIGLHLTLAVTIAVDAQCGLPTESR